MTFRSLALSVPLLVALSTPAMTSAATASGRHWELSIERLACEPGQGVLVLATRVRYLGPEGLAEAPLNQLAVAGDKPRAPRGLVWRGGSKPLAAWFSSGGLRKVNAGDSAELEFRYEVRDLAGDLKLEFGDVPAIPLTGGAGKAPCERLLDPARIKAPRRASRADGAKSALRIHREAYPCSPASGGPPRRIEAQYPPYLPEQLLVFGRGYLPNARRIDLPMGSALAQPYAYSGPDELASVEEAAKRALAANFPAHAAGRTADGKPGFAFNWGAQRTPAGNELYSVGIYALRPCP